MNERLWKIDDLEEYFQSSRSAIYRSVTCKKTFPKAIKPEGFGKRWVPEEVREWTLKQRDV